MFNFLVHRQNAKFSSPSFLKRCNCTVNKEFIDLQILAEDIYNGTFDLESKVFVLASLFPDISLIDNKYLKDKRWVDVIALYKDFYELASNIPSPPNGSQAQVIQDMDEAARAAHFNQIAPIYREWGQVLSPVPVKSYSDVSGLLSNPSGVSIELYLPNGVYEISFTVSQAIDGLFNPRDLKLTITGNGVKDFPGGLGGVDVSNGDAEPINVTQEFTIDSFNKILVNLNGDDPIGQYSNPFSNIVITPIAKIDGNSQPLEIKKVKEIFFPVCC